MPHSNQPAHIFSSLAIWEHFTNTSGATPENITLVNAHISYAMPLLDQYIKAFPKYTLHNNKHQINIIKLMGDILGEDVTKLTALECTMLIMSCIYHDIGMVFNETELENVAAETDFQTFLDKNIKAKLEYEENDRKPTPGLIEWYCRWMHATRVWIYLNKVHVTHPLKWENITIKDKLGHLCESHNQSVSDIIGNLRTLDNDYLGKCDLMFCAILLRLADILDFDSSRSPKSVYEFLDLDNPKNKLDAVTKIEWEKHLNSNGFEFKRTAGDLKIIFSASTPHPNIEQAIKGFIQTINSELAASKKLMKFCSDRWKDHLLADEINIDNLTPDNYESGNYHFSLSEDKILTLLTGDGLYNDDFVFIRELLQNAIDATRHREFHEQIANPSFKASPINVSFFTDQQGYQWIRIDDNGMGMNEDIITQHLLKKGESYYNSDKFKLEKIYINKKSNKDFVPISRFGIGLLSCFIAGDKIEISTKHNSARSASIRLGIEGRNSSYVFQTSTKRHNPLLMPSPHSTVEGFRNEAGTSIAVRITTNKEFVGFDMKKELERFVLASPIPVMYDGEKIGGDEQELLYKPWSKSQVIDIDETFVTKVEERFEIKFKNGIKINIEDIDISNGSFSDNLKGQVIFVAVDGDYEENHTPKRSPRFRLSEESEKLILKVYANEIIEGKQTEIEELIDLTSIKQEITVPDKLAIDRYSGRKDRYFENFALSHNGIVIYDNKGLFSLEGNTLNNETIYSGYNNFSFRYCGIIYFQDQLLPDLTVSRNEIKGLSFDLLANLSFALEPLNKYIKYENYKFSFFDRRHGRHEYTSEDVEKSGFYNTNQKFLDEYIKLEVMAGVISIAELRQENSEKTEFNHVRYDSRFYDTLVDYVIEQNFEVSMEFISTLSDGKYFINKRTSVFPRELQRFDPLTFIKFENHSDKLNIGNKVNIDHPYTQWYIKASDYLDKDYFYYSKQLIYELVAGNSFRNLTKIKHILAKLDEVLPIELKPSQYFSLSENDFGEDIKVQ